MVTMSMSEQEAGVLREWLEPKLVDLRREISHTDSPRFRVTLHQVEDALERLVNQLPNSVAS